MKEWDTKGDQMNRWIHKVQTLCIYSNVFVGLTRFSIKMVLIVYFIFADTMAVSFNIRPFNGIVCAQSICIWSHTMLSKCTDACKPGINRVVLLGFYFNFKSGPFFHYSMNKNLVSDSGAHKKALQIFIFQMTKSQRA